MPLSRWCASWSLKLSGSTSGTGAARQARDGRNVVAWAVAAGRRHPRLRGGHEMSDTGESQIPPDGEIVTFYSFKGGTGRTMALANVGWILAANGKRVLVADWDLESPGLYKFFRPFLDEGAGEGPGIVDFIRRYEWAAAEAEIDRDALEGANEQAKKAALEAIDSLVDDYIA